MLRLLSCLAAALALFFSPIAMSGGGGMAMAHGAPAQAAQMDGHCGGGHDAPGETRPDAKIGCASACAALEPTGAPAAADFTPAPQPLAQAAHQVLIGVHPEGETPPPRMTPEI